MSIIERQLQLYLNFNDGQLTTALHSQRQSACTSARKEVSIYIHKCILDESPIPVVVDTKFLGVLFDKSYALSPNFTVCEAGTSLDWDGDTKVCHFTFCRIKTVLYIGTRDN